MSQRTSRPGNGKLGLNLKLQFPSSEKALLVKKAVTPELNAHYSKRSRTSIGIKNRIISINIKAQDPIAMRASLNSCLKSIILAKRITEV